MLWGCDMTLYNEQWGENMDIVEKKYRLIELINKHEVWGHEHSFDWLKSDEALNTRLRLEIILKAMNGDDYEHPEFIRLDVLCDWYEYLELLCLKIKSDRQLDDCIKRVRNEIQ